MILCNDHVYNYSRVNSLKCLNHFVLSSVSRREFPFNSLQCIFTILNLDTVAYAKMVEGIQISGHNEALLTQLIYVMLFRVLIKSMDLERSIRVQRLN